MTKQKINNHNNEQLIKTPCLISELGVKHAPVNVCASSAFIEPSCYASQGPLPCYALLRTAASPLKEEQRVNKPFIFVKKQKKDFKVISFKVKTTDTGKSIHHTPAAQEWKTSIYAYNLNYNKSLPVKDKFLMNLVTNYLKLGAASCLHSKKPNTKIKIKPKKRKGFAHKVTVRKSKRSIVKKLSAKKLFLAKGNLKHTNSNIIITLYIYDTEYRYLLYCLYNEIKTLHFDYRQGLKDKKPFNYQSNPVWPLKLPKDDRFKFSLKKDDKTGKKIWNKCGRLERVPSRRLSLFEYMFHPKMKHYFYYRMWLLDIFRKNFKKNKKYFKALSSLRQSKDLTNHEKLFFILNTKSFKNVKLPSYLVYWYKLRDNYDSYYSLLRRKWMLYRRKFNYKYLDKLIIMANKIYFAAHKKVEFNIVNLKKMHLNSDIFTQAVTLKLRNRDNKLYRTLKRSLLLVRLRNVVRSTVYYNKGKKEQLLINKLRNMKINSLFANYAEITNKDYLNNLLLRFYLKSDNIKREKKAWSLGSVKYPISLTKYVISSLKHNKLAGIRVEAKGRLTKRFTASRSVFKMRCKGGLKNIDSSFRGLPAVILRGHVKSNVEYTVLHSKNRNGAFGVKGWVSSK